jgi:hypothetical protein
VYVVFKEEGIVAHVLSPRRYVVADGIPDADKDADSIPDVVIVPPVKFIKVLLLAPTLVTVPPPGTPV